MKNKIFVRCIYICAFAGFLVNLRSMTSFIDSETAGTILYSGFGSALTEMGNRMQSSLIPGLAAGFAGLMMSRRLHLWQGCLLCLLLPFFDVLFLCVLIPLLKMVFLSESSSINMAAFIFNYTMSQYYAFTVFFIVLVFYGILEKDRIITLLCTLWNIGWFVFLALIPPFFPQFNIEQLGMDRGEATRRTLLFGLSHLAVVLLIFFILYDLYNIKSRQKQKDENL